MTTWDHESKALFRNARAAISPALDDRERVRSRLASKLGAATVGVAVSAVVATATTPAAAGAGTASAASKGTLMLIAKIGLPILILGGAAVVASPRLFHASSDVIPVSKVVVTSARDVSPAPATQGVESEPRVIDVADLPTAAPPRDSAPKVAANAVAVPSVEEAELVGAIDSALRSGDSAVATRLVDEHAKRFPHGVLVEEREGARILARCGAGSKDEVAAMSFVTSHPRSPLRARIVATCGVSDQDNR